MIYRNVNDLDSTFVALADPTRRHVVEMLRHGPRRASELAAGSGMSRPAMSRHLKVLRATGLVDVEMLEADARGRVYTLRAENFVALQAWLDQVHAFWTEQLGSFKEHAEKTRGSLSERREPGISSHRAQAPGVSPEPASSERAPSGPARRAKSGNNA
jgi:DNA-binding transcriptional ArsR family regulator